MSEIEAAILILAKERNSIFEMIEKVIKKNGYVPDRNGIQNINDRYFDTQNNDLEQKKIALRIRMIDGKAFKITLKMLKMTTENYSNRSELEATWSQDSFCEIVNKLKSTGINLGDCKHYYHEDPVRTLEYFRLSIFQNRLTSRHIINAIDKASRQIEFEFAVDNTRFIMDDEKKFGYSELEIESKKIGNEQIISKFIKELTINPEFRYWPYSKLETGMAINYLFKNKKLIQNTNYDKNYSLTDMDFEKISDFLKSKNRDEM
jgi:inorganic triphosphatase YgiF